jgi:hypothetical protein
VQAPDDGKEPAFVRMVLHKSAGTVESEMTKGLFIRKVIERDWLILLRLRRAFRSALAECDLAFGGISSYSRRHVRAADKAGRIFREDSQDAALSAFPRRLRARRDRSVRVR